MPYARPEEKRSCGSSAGGMDVEDLLKDIEGLKALIDDMVRGKVPQTSSIDPSQVLRAAKEAVKQLDAEEEPEEGHLTATRAKLFDGAKTLKHRSGMRLRTLMEWRRCSSQVMRSIVPAGFAG
jgi:hypothetical protein